MSAPRIRPRRVSSLGFMADNPTPPGAGTATDANSIDGTSESDDGRRGGTRPAGGAATELSGGVPAPARRTAIGEHCADESRLDRGRDGARIRDAGNGDRRRAARVRGGPDAGGALRGAARLRER